MGAQTLIDSELTELQLEQLVSGHWGVGYEPEIDDFNGWREALREIVRLCDKYKKMDEFGSKVNPLPGHP